MTPAQFIALWQNNPLSERAGAQAHFDDLCELLGVDKPRDADNYCFERGAKKAGGGDGWADVWKRGHFGWENKRPGRDLKAALKQLTDYSLELENPPLLVVCDRERIEIHTAFTGYPDDAKTILIANLDQPENLQTLRWIFTDPEKLRPVKSLAAITAEAAGQFALLSETLRKRGLEPPTIAHFLIQCLFCMFAEDEGLLPRGIFTGLLTKSADDPTRAANRLTALFTAMQSGGDYGDDAIAWFNGGLFKIIAVPQLERAELIALQHASEMDWRNIDPSIFGTLFERGLNPAKRSQLGAHYTDPATIMRLIEPVIVRPLLAEWQRAATTIAALTAKSRKQNDKPYKDAAGIFQSFLERLRNFRVLDPACGSGNFLYLALKSLKDIERRVNTEAEQLGLQRQVSIEVSPANVLGIELDPYAAELARVTVWIGEIQWMLRNGYPVSAQPILRPLDTIENRDALMNYQGTTDWDGIDANGNEIHGEMGIGFEAEWPVCDVIVGNPPFLGGSKKRGELGHAYFNSLASVFTGRVPGGADLVCYWFDKARAHIVGERCSAAGLVTTQSIRNGSNRKVLDSIAAESKMFEAWSDEPWVNDGAAVRVSLVCFGRSDSACRLDGQPVASINADLTVGGGGIDFTKASMLSTNAAVSFEGTKKYGAFDISGEIARQWIGHPNVHGKNNSEVVKPWANGQDVAKRPSDTWIIDFGTDMPEAEACLFEFPFQHALEHVKPYRQTVNRERTRRNWWLHEEARIAMRHAVKNLNRFIVTPRVAKYRFFVWLDRTVLPDSRLNVIARADDASFGILSSRLHELWALANASIHGDGVDGGRPTYNAKSCFETFPFPTGLTPRDTAPIAGQTSPPCMANEVVAANIAAAARRLNELRESWLNPPEWVDWVITPEEEKAGFPKRPIAKPGFEAELKKRTLTNLYNARPAWLDNAHKTLDAAVAMAYGWNDYTAGMPDEEILRRLLALNLARKAAEPG